MEVLVAPRTGLSLKSPVMTASGVFGYGIECAARMDLKGLGAVVSKGTTREPRAGNEPMRLWETPAGILNSIGLQNVGVEAVVAEKAPIWATWEVPVLVNVSGVTVEDFAFLVSRLDGVPGIAGIELNISCPNIKEGGILFASDPNLAHEVTAAARRATTLPLIVKLSPNTADIRSVAAAVEAAGADAVSLINTLYGMAMDVSARRPALTSIAGGLSGPAIKPHALHLVYQVAQEVTIPVIGIGGIMSAADALEFLLAGATAVEIGTALMVDPTRWRTIATDLKEWCRKEAIESLDEIIGAGNTRFVGRSVNREADEIKLAGSG
jgi:dihydroorotate dehydrogenase (NAD+) catalytic subunit